MTNRRIEFLRDFSFKPEPRVTQVFVKGQVAFVTLACAEKAVASGAARPVELAAPPPGIAATIARAGRKPRRKRAHAGNE